MEEGTLFTHLKKNKVLPEKEVAIWIKQIASAVKYLHENTIAHRDIKPENIVMSHVQIPVDLGCLQTLWFRLGNCLWWPTENLLWYIRLCTSINPRRSRVWFHSRFVVSGCADILVAGGEGSILPYQQEGNYEADSECKWWIDVGGEQCDWIPWTYVEECSVIHRQLDQEEPEREDGQRHHPRASFFKECR